MAQNGASPNSKSLVILAIYVCVCVVCLRVACVRDFLKGLIATATTTTKCVENMEIFLKCFVDCCRAMAAR